MKKQDAPKAFMKGHTKMKPTGMEKVTHSKGPKPTGGSAAAMKKGHTAMGGRKGY